MLYIVIPEGMVFAKKMVTDTNSITEEKDVFVDREEGKPDIILQDIVKEYLKSRDKSKSFEVREGITIYHRKPPNTDADFLAYEPKANGKYPASEFKMVKGQASYKLSSYATTYGQRWFNQIPLSEERLQEIRLKDLETRDNRRHIGDSPKAT